MNYQWDNSNELRVNLKFTMDLHGYKCFTMKQPGLVGAVLKPDGTLDVTLFAGNVRAALEKGPGRVTAEGYTF